MQYFLDSAHPASIAQALEAYPLAGVTTNPSIIAREHREFRPLIEEIRGILGPQPALHAQAVSPDAAGMVAEALALREYAGENFFIKVPVTPEGLKAIKRLKAEGMKVTATVIFSPQQALMAARAGADWCAPYVNALDDLCADGAKVVAEMVELFRLHGLPAQVLAASFRNVDQVHRVALAGAQAITLPFDFFPKLVHHPSTEAAVRKFTADWEKVYGE